MARGSGARAGAAGTASASRSRLQFPSGGGPVKAGDLLEVIDENCTNDATEDWWVSLSEGLARLDYEDEQLRRFGALALWVCFYAVLYVILILQCSSAAAFEVNAGLTQAMAATQPWAVTSLSGLFAWIAGPFTDAAFERPGYWAGRNRLVGPFTFVSQRGTPAPCAAGGRFAAFYPACYGASPLETRQGIAGPPPSPLGPELEEAVRLAAGLPPNATAAALARGSAPRPPVPPNARRQVYSEAVGGYVAVLDPALGRPRAAALVRLWAQLAAQPG